MVNITNASDLPRKPIRYLKWRIYGYFRKYSFLKSISISFKKAKHKEISCTTILYVDNRKSVIILKDTGLWPLIYKLINKVKQQSIKLKEIK